MRATVMEDQLISIIIAGVALVGILVKIVRDEVLRRHNPNFDTLDAKIEGLRSQVSKLANALALFTQSTEHYRERSLEHLKGIRDALDRRT